MKKGTSLAMGSLLSIMMSPSLSGQAGKIETQEPTANVKILAYEANGRFLGVPNVEMFENYDHRNLALRFRNGVANGIPFGIYRIEARIPGYFSGLRYVRVYQATVTVVMGLAFSYELPMKPPSLRGRVVGQMLPAHRFVKLVSVYENISIESEIASDGTFNLGGLSPGLFILFVAGENGIVACRTITFPYTGDPLELDLGRACSLSAH